MRTTIRLDDRLMAAAKHRAAETGRTFTAVVEDALRQSLAPARHPGKRTPVKLRTVNGRGVHPGIDLDDSAALLDLMESSR
jgi:Arc/MetJ family transcription regulator